MATRFTGSFELQSSDLHQRHGTSPYVGTRFRGVVRRTIRRGETIFKDGQITAATNDSPLARQA